MRINHNIAALNTHRQLNAANANQSKSMEKLSSGLRINRAGDDAAGLAISEKMRAQVRGLDQASSNAQDGISLIQTAEGALNETHDILQRMRELATQAANDTNVGVDRNEIQKEINQLSSEINRIGNTTEFNTQSLLKGDGKTNLTSSGLISSNVSEAGTNVVHTQAEATITFSADNLKETGKKMEFTLNGIKLTVNTLTDAGLSSGDVVYQDDATDSSATIKVDDAATSAKNSADATAAAIQAMIDKNDLLKGQYTAVSDGTSKVTIKAVADGEYDGAKGVINITEDLTANPTLGLTGANGTTTSATTATTELDFTTATGSAIDSADKVKELIGKGFTINGQQVEFYNANDGEYKGNAIGINISDAVNATADWDQALAKTVASQLNNLEGISAKETAANSGKIKIETNATGSNAKLEITDGGNEENFKAIFQVGANTGQSMTISIADMRSEALGITGKAGTAGFTSSNAVTDGTNNTEKEAALDVSTHENASAAIKVINDAIEKVSAQRSNLGAFQNRLDHTINNLGTSSENLTAAESRIRDVDMAKEMMNQTRESILAQASQAMLAQANQKPQSVLQLLQ